MALERPCLERVRIDNSEFSLPLGYFQQNSVSTGRGKA